MKNVIKEIEIDLSLKEQDVMVPMGGTLLEKVVTKSTNAEGYIEKDYDPTFLLCHVEIDEEPAYEKTVTIMIVKSDETFELGEEDDIEYLDTIVSKNKTYHIGVVLPEKEE